MIEPVPKSPEREGKQSQLVAEAYVIDLGSPRRSSVITARTKVNESDIQKKATSGLPPWLAAFWSVRGPR